MRTEDWPWSSLRARTQGPEELRKILYDIPGGRPAGWVQYVNQPITPSELARMEASEERNRPYGEQAWVGKVVGKLGLEYTIRDPWRPKKQE